MHPNGTFLNSLTTQECNKRWTSRLASLAHSPARAHADNDNAPPAHLTPPHSCCVYGYESTPDTFINTQLRHMSNSRYNRHTTNHSQHSKDIVRITASACSLSLLLFVFLILRSSFLLFLQNRPTVSCSLLTLTSTCPCGLPRYVVVYMHVHIDGWKRAERKMQKRYWFTLVTLD